MLNRKSLVYFLLVVSLVLCSFFSISYAETGENAKLEELEPITLKIALLYAPTSTKGLAATHYKELVEKYSEGKIKCNVYPGAQLGPLNAMIEGVRSGTVDMYIESLNTWQSYNELLKLHNMAFAFKDRATFVAHLATPIFQEKVIEPFLEDNILFLNSLAGWNWDWPFRVIVSKHLILVPEDIVGYNFLLPEMKAYVESWRAIGATPVIIPWNEVYLSFQMGLVDIITMTVTSVYDMKVTEIAKYVTKIEDYYQTMALAVQKSKFESYPKEYQEILLKACTETGEWYTNLEKKEIERSIKLFTEENDAEFHETDRAPFIEKGKKAINILEESGYLIPGLYDQVMNSIPNN